MDARYEKCEPGDQVVTFFLPCRLFNTMKIEEYGVHMLTIDVERVDDVTVVHCAGRLVRGAEVSTLRSAVVSETKARIVVLDLSQLEFMDGGGLNALVALHHWTRNHGVQLKLVNPPSLVNEMLTRTRLHRVFEVSSLHDALKVLSGARCHPSKYAAGLFSQPQVVAAK